MATGAAYSVLPLVVVFHFEHQDVAIALEWWASCSKKLLMLWPLFKNVLQWLQCLVPEEIITAVWLWWMQVEFWIFVKVVVGVVHHKSLMRVLGIFST
jgi:hypothetical protein